MFTHSDTCQQDTHWALADSTAAEGPTPTRSFSSGILAFEQRFHIQGSVEPKPSSLRVAGNNVAVIIYKISFIVSKEHNQVIAFLKNPTFQEVLLML